MLCTTVVLIGQHAFATNTTVVSPIAVGVQAAMGRRPGRPLTSAAFCWLSAYLLPARLRNVARAPTCTDNMRAEKLRYVSVWEAALWVWCALCVEPPRSFCLLWLWCRGCLSWLATSFLEFDWVFSLPFLSFVLPLLCVLSFAVFFSFLYFTLLFFSVFLRT